MIAARSTRLLVSTLGAVCMAFIFDAQAAQAAGHSSTSEALQIGVEVVRPCAIDTYTRPAASFDTVGREALLRATQSALLVSCGSSEARVRVSDVRVDFGESSLESNGTLPRLDVEF